MTLSPKIAAFIALMVLQLLDVYTTARVLTQGGRERNPALAWLMSKIGPISAMLLTKALFMSLLWWQLGAAPASLLALFCGVYLVVVINNAKLIK